MKKIKGTQVAKEEIKVLLFADNMIAYVSDPQNSTIYMDIDITMNCTCVCTYKI